MAELPKEIRRIGGSLESIRQPYGQRLLLPAEVELCEVLGISEEEYFYFVEKTAAYNGERKEGYELIPDIKNELVTTVAGVTKLTALGQVAVAVALTAVGYLLTPKPKPLKQQATIEGDDLVGTKRFSPQFAFNSLQELAKIGDVIPLVFANKQLVVGSSSEVGGVRVNGQLLWSQLLSLGKLQQLKAITLFSLGEVEGKPDFDGYAIGDLLLSAYCKGKADLFFRPGVKGLGNNRIIKGDEYSESNLEGIDYPYTDIFSARWPVTLSGNHEPVAATSGARNPTTQSVFGLYSPMPNANVVKLPFELALQTKGASDDAALAVATKVKKVNTFFPTRAGFVGGNVSAKGNTVTYRILKSRQFNDQTYETGYKPHGIGDVQSMVRSIREEIDANIAVGESYMAGDGLITCTHIKSLNGDDQSGPWREEVVLEDGRKLFDGIERQYTFKVQEEGTDYTFLDEDGTQKSFFKHPNLLEHEQQPKWLSEEKDRQIINGRKDKFVLNIQDMSDHSLEFGFAYRSPILQRVALGTITNSRACSMTEIGLKSKVFSTCRGVNMNSVPIPSELDKIFNDRVNFQAGTIDVFLTRFSFFYLEVRKAGSNEDFIRLSNKSSDHTGLFAIRGNTPEFQYNYIKVIHENRLSQLEYRFKPYPGNNIPVFHLNQKVNLLNATVTNEKQQEQQFVVGNFVVGFAGTKEFVLSKKEIFNTEWIVSLNTGKGTVVPTGEVLELSNYSLKVNGQKSQVTITSVSVPSGSSDYEYDVAKGPTAITLISKVPQWPEEDKDAYVVYVNGVEVGHDTFPKGTALTDIIINSDDGSEFYRTDGVVQATKHPEDNSIDVEYYGVTSAPNLIMSPHPDS